MFYREYEEVPVQRYLEYEEISVPREEGRSSVHCRGEQVGKGDGEKELMLPQEWISEVCPLSPNPLRGPCWPVTAHLCPGSR